MKTKKPSTATSTVTQSRVPVFLPRERPLKAGFGSDTDETVDIVVGTEWGVAMLPACPLDQRHRDLLDVLMTHHNDSFEHDDGALSLMCSLYTLQKHLGIKPVHHHRIIQHLEDMASTSIVLRNHRSSWTAHYKMVDYHAYIDDEAEKFKKKRYHIRLSPGFMALYQHDLKVHYPALLPKILAIKNPVARALARHCVTHRDYKRTLVDALKEIGAIDDYTPARTIRHQKQAVKTQADLLAVVGIEVDDKRVAYAQHESVWFESNEKSQKAG